MIKRHPIISLLACSSLYACSLAPDYHKPEVAMPAQFKEAQGGWLPAKPEDANNKRSNWWSAYGDSELDSLEEKAGKNNQDIKAAVARYDEARASVKIARSGYFPAINGNADGIRQKHSSTVADVFTTKPFNDIMATADLSYEIDLWGRIRNTVQASKSQAKASAADLAAMDLSIRAELAMDYFTLRYDDSTKQILDEMVASYQKAYDLVKLRHEGGIAAEIDVDRAKSQLESTKTMAADIRLKRAQMEHAVAVLAGEQPSSFSIQQKKTYYVVPPVVPDIPSKLLDQRPDIAAAASHVEAANAEIGVARAAWLPDFSFNLMGGFESALATKLFNAPSSVWSLGPAVVMPLFDGGKLNGISRQARAAYDESVANYRQTVLVAFQQVEDNLVALHQLGEETKTQSEAAKSAEHALAQANNLYKGGATTYLDVVVAQNTAQQAELSLIDVQTKQLTSSVMLIRALGGGWKRDGKQAN